MRYRVQRLALSFAGTSLLSVALAGPAVAVDKWVTMYANEYRPGVVTIQVGDTVTWVNDDDVEHDAVGRGWRTSMLGYYESDSVRFNRAGTYPYRCSIHPQMRSSVVVRGASGGASGGGSGATVPPTDTLARPASNATSTISWPGLGTVAIAALVAMLVVERRLLGRRRDR